MPARPPARSLSCIKAGRHRPELTVVNGVAALPCMVAGMDSPASLAAGPVPPSGGRAQPSCAGLSEAEAARRQARYGPNEFRRGGSGILGLVAAAVANPLVAILIAAAATSG